MLILKNKPIELKKSITETMKKIYPMIITEVAISLVLCVGFSPIKEAIISDLIIIIIIIKIR